MCQTGAGRISRPSLGVGRLAFFSLRDEPVREEFKLQPSGLWKTKEKVHKCSRSIRPSVCQPPRLLFVVLDMLTQVKGEGQTAWAVQVFTEVAGRWLQISIKAGLSRREAALLVGVFAVERYIFPMRDHGVCNVERPTLHATDDHTAPPSRDQAASCENNQKHVRVKNQKDVLYICVCAFSLFKPIKVIHFGVFVAATLKKHHLPLQCGGDALQLPLGWQVIFWGPSSRKFFLHR